MKYKIHEHGYVKLVDSMGSDLSPLESARMSTDNPTGVDDSKDDRLRERLWSDMHTSPFESNVLALEMQLPMFVLRQIDRHRTLSIDNVEITDYDEFRKWTSRNEFSARYSQMPDLFWLPAMERIKKQSKANKQGSGEELSDEFRLLAMKIMEDNTSVCREAYEKLVAMGVANELARIVLPANQYTKIRITASLLHWFKFLDLRLRSDVQEETRNYATAVQAIIQLLWPKCNGVFCNYTLLSSRLSLNDRCAAGGAFDWSVLEEYAVEELDMTPAQVQKLREKLMPPEVEEAYQMSATSSSGGPVIRVE